MSNAYDLGFKAYGLEYGRNDYPSYFSDFQIREWQRGWNAACYEIGEIYG